MDCKPKIQLDVPFGATEVLLHTCCAPCSSAIIECLLDNGVRPTIFYCNPNICPEEEYARRKDECSRYAESLGLDIVDDDYDHQAWLDWITSQGGADVGTAPERGPRCLLCFRYRLLRSALYAYAHDFQVLTTTLASSRWKSLYQINDAGIWAVERVCRSNLDSGCSGRLLAPDGPDQGNCAAGGQKLVWWGQNWRKGGLQERRVQLIREYGFYNQTWCGCEFSIRRHD